MTYAATLALAKANNIDLGKLNTAEEVAATFGIDHKDYESICLIIYAMWLKCDVSIQVWHLVASLKQLLENKQITLENVLTLGDDYDKVVENACYM